MPNMAKSIMIRYVLDWITEINNYDLTKQAIVINMLLFKSKVSNIESSIVIVAFASNLQAYHIEISSG